MKQIQTELNKISKLLRADTFKMTNDQEGFTEQMAYLSSKIIEIGDLLEHYRIRIVKDFKKGQSIETVEKDYKPKFKGIIKLLKEYSKRIDEI